MGDVDGPEGGDAMSQLSKTLCRPFAWGLLLALLVLLLHAPVAGAVAASRQGSSEPTPVTDNGPDNLSKQGGGDGGQPPPSPVDEGDPDDYGRPVQDIVFVKALLAGLYFMMPR
jgi:hypothetical protein